MRYAQGAVLDPPFYAEFKNYLQQLVDPSSISVDIVNVNDVVVLNDAAPERVSLGRFRFDDYTVPEDAPVGLWRIEWSAVVEGVAVEGSEFFEIVEPGDIELPSGLEATLRTMIGERIPVGGTAADTMFSDVEISDFLSQNENDLNRAALAGWLAKMAEFAKLVDRDETGANKKLSQMFKHAEQMASHYRTLVSASSTASTRAVGARVAVWGDDLYKNRVYAGSATYRGVSQPLRFALDHPDTYAADPSYPQPGQVPT